MARRVAHAQGAVLGDGKALAVVEFALWFEGGVLPLAGWRGTPEYRGAGGGLQRGGRGRVVQMGMRGEDPADRTGCGSKDGAHVLGIVRARIDHGPFIARAAAYQVGVGARARHHVAVVGGHAPDALGQPYRHDRCQLITAVRVAVGIDAADLGVARLVGHHRAHAGRAGGQPRHDAGNAAQLRVISEAGRGALKLCDRAQRAARDVHQRQAAGGIGGLAGADPAVLHDLGAVGHGHLAFGGDGDKEARIETLGQAWRRQPVAVIGEPVGSQAQAQLLASVGQAGAAALHRLAQQRLPGGVELVRRLQAPVAVAGKQQAGLFIAFAQGGQVEVQAAGRQAQAFAGNDVVQAVGMRVQGLVLRVERAAGKNVGAAAAVVGAFDAAYQQHFHAGRRIAHDEQAGGGAQQGGRSGSAVAACLCGCHCVGILVVLAARNWLEPGGAAASHS